MLSRFLNPKNDAAFKKTFGCEKNKDILIHFLNDVLVFKAGKKIITDVKFLSPILDPEIIREKTSIVDILCEDQDGNKYIVEMQVANDNNFVHRAQYYAAKLYASQLQIGDNYSELKEVIFLAITDFIMFPKKAACISHHIILDKETYEHDLEDFSFTFIELPKFKKTITQVNTIIEKWLYFLNHAEDIDPEELAKMIGDDLIIKKAFEQLNSLNWSKEELSIYEQIEKNERDVLDAKVVVFNRGKAEGLDEGKKIGLDEGKKIGLDEGKKIGLDEGKKVGIEEGVRNTVNKLLKKGMCSKDIASVLEISETQLEELIKD